MAQTPNPRLLTPRIIGIGGLTRSGKDSLAELFIKNGWFGVSLGDIIREHSRERHKNASDPISVENMTETANWLRGAKGPDFALKIALNEFNKVQNQYKGLVLFSIRAPIEADYILANGGQLIWVEAKDKVRHQRWLSSLRKDEKPISLKEFNAHENLQYNPQPGIPEQVQMNSSYVQSRATIIIQNNGSDLRGFHDAAKSTLKDKI
jgi:dephospho-CoA kinase